MRCLQTLQILIFLCLSSVVFGQQDSTIIGYQYPPVNEDKLIETVWKYTYVTHTQSNEKIHQADEFYNYFLYLRYDYSYQQHINGKEEEGSWFLNNEKNEILYNFRGVKWWKIAEFTKNSLVLEFTLSSNNSTYQYHFVSANASESPFEVITTATVGKKETGNNVVTNEPKKPRKPSEPKENEGVEIEIALIGGGFFGGPDPVIKDYILIKNNGRLIKEYESTQLGLRKTRKDIPREDIEQLAEFIISNHFFDYERIYDCDSALCRKRQSNKPTPIPLRLSVKYGSRHKVVTISIWGIDSKYKGKYVDYPKELDMIIKGIQDLAEG